jgi:hypothetical protein
MILTSLQEDGVDTAIQSIYRDLEYAKSLIKNRVATEDQTDELEEAWTFIGDDGDPEVLGRMHEWERMASVPSEMEEHGVAREDFARIGTARDRSDVSPGNRVISGKGVPASRTAV